VPDAGACAGLTWQIDVHRHCRNRRFTNIWGGSTPAPGADRLARPARLSELILADVNSQSGERGFARVANASRDISLDVGIDVLLELLEACEGGAAKRLPLQDREPDLDLIEPRRAGRRETKLHIGMGLEPMLVLLVGVVVEDDFEAFGSEKPL
jgi:hypothetical protein